MLMAVFATALLSVLVMGMLQLNTEEIQLVRNQISATEALATAEAGLNNALSELRADRNWNAGFTDKVFNASSYTVDITGSTITSTGTSAQGFTGRIEADITIAGTSPYMIRIDHFRINE